MTATAHALIGGAIAASVPNPFLGVSLATISHPLVDMIPHWDFGRGWRNKNKLTFLLEGVFDLGVGLVSSYLIFGQHINFWYFLLVVFSSLFFDLVQIPYWFLNWRIPPFSWAYRIQSRIGGKATLPWGILTQAATVTGLVLVLRTVH